ncbi:MAG: DUF2062 domain-containing protein [Reichenbachiella sp.]|uniref:DUF2062 domain-containing protein n=2 Tax=Reichenbachiella sp. TaxID=2184521 RepID=UPI003262F52D
MSCCVVVPTYNNAATLTMVLRGVEAHTKDIIVVNDGSTDQTNEVLNEFGHLDQIGFSENQGKGQALRSAFTRAIELGYNYAITIDSDGQHSTDDLPLMFEAIRSNPGKLIMGSRTMKAEGIPKKSSFGNQFSNFWFWAETGLRLSDTQTGFRAYPLNSIKGMKWFTKRFEFEIEAIVRLAWRNVKFVEQPISVAYEEDRVSHFRPFQDFARISVLNTVLFTSALLFFLPRLWIWNFSFSGFWHQIKNEFTSGSHSPIKLAASVGLGLFFGIFPIWGFQMAAAFALASIMRLNRVVVLLSSNISIPPFLPFVIYFSFQLGSVFFTKPVEFLNLDSIDLSTIHIHLSQYLVGAVLLSILTGVFGFFVVLSTLKFFNFRKRKSL